MRRRHLIILSLSFISFLCAVIYLKNNILELDKAAELKAIIPSLPADTPKVLFPAEKFTKILPSIDVKAANIVFAKENFIDGSGDIYLIKPLPANSGRFFEVQKQTLPKRTMLAGFDSLSAGRVDNTGFIPAQKLPKGLKYGKEDWDFIEKLDTEIGTSSMRCLGVHPEPQYSVRVIWPVIAGAKKAVIYFAMRNSADFEKKRTLSVSITAFDKDSKPVGTAEAKLKSDDLRKWMPAALDLKNAETLQIEMRPDEGGRNHFCMMGELIE